VLVVHGGQPVSQLYEFSLDLSKCPTGHLASSQIRSALASTNCGPNECTRHGTKCQHHSNLAGGIRSSSGQWEPFFGSLAFDFTSFQIRLDITARN
jgi:hypothetical protein